MRQCRRTLFQNLILHAHDGGEIVEETLEELRLEELSAELAHTLVHGQEAAFVEEHTLHQET